MFRKLLGLSITLLALPAFAGDISYNFVEKYIGTSITSQKT